MDTYPGPTVENLSCIPPTLQHVPQWVYWYGRDLIDRTTGAISFTKIPINPHTLQYADTTDPQTWGAYPSCVAGLATFLEDCEHRDPVAYRGGGLGFVVTAQDPFCGIDLDHCLDPVTGDMAPWAQTIVQQLDSYTEITPSGTGLRIWVEGTLPPRGRKKGDIELYDARRFFTLTGWHIPDTPSGIAARQPQLSTLWGQVFGPQVGEAVWLLDTHGTITNHTGSAWTITRIAPDLDGTPYAFFVESPGGWPLLQCEKAPARSPTSGGVSGPLSDALVLEHASRAANAAKFHRLWAGDWQGYPSQSEADLALCLLLAFWTQDPGQLDTLFRQSGCLRAKWDEVHGACTYGARTIQEAFARQTEHYQGATMTVPPRQHTLSLAGGRTQVSSPTDDPVWGTPFDFSQAVPATSLLKMMLVPPRFLVSKLIPDGLTILAAPAKSYKSYFALSLALATIGEGDWCETFPVESQGPVVFFGLESPLMQIRNRLHQLRPTFDAAQAAYPLTFFSGMHALPSFRNGLQPALEQVIERYRPRLIVIDPLSYLYRLGRQDDLAGATLDLLWPLAEMTATAQVALLAAEHMRKRSKEDISVVDQLAGSHIKAAVVHGLLLMHREGEDLIMETTMRDAGPQELALTLTFDGAGNRVYWGYKGANATLGQSRLDSLRAKVMAELQAKRYPHKVLDLITSLSLPNTESTKNHLRQILHRAEHVGEIAVSKRGEYYWIGQT